MLKANLNLGILDEIPVIEDNSGPETRNNDGLVISPNPHLNQLQTDHLYHLALNTATHDLKAMFGDVKFVCVGGTYSRMREFAIYIGDQLGIKLPTGVQLHDITQKSYRYSMYKIGPVLSVNHGMGTPSLSILLHELFKLICYAKCKDVIFLRLGTSGGIGVEPGTLVISNGAVDGLLRSFYELHILGQTVRRPSVLDQQLIAELEAVAREEIKAYPVVSGTTMCTSDFYESQARLDGFFCNFAEEEKMKHLQHLREAGVANIEMESVTFASMCHYAGIKGAIICVTVVDRLNDDQVNCSKEESNALQRRPQELAAKFIKKRLGLTNL